MKRYIDVKNNIVAFAPPQQFVVDCSNLLKQNIVFVGEDALGFWTEADPFVGQNRTVSTQTIQKLFTDAEQAYKQNWEESKATWYKPN